MPEGDLAPFSALDRLECPRCHSVHDAERLTNLCTCGSPLLVRYDLERVRRSVTKARISDGAHSLWRYHELLPVRQPSSVVTLGEGMTPLLPLSQLGSSLGMKRLLLKDEGQLPTGSFKARGAAVGVSRARELGAQAIAMPTNGNAGAAWATYAARAGLTSHIVMPIDAPVIARAECAAAGARLTLVRGHIGDAGRMVAEAISRRADVFDVSTLKEPYRIEGKKTMGYEIVEQLGWQLPDVVVYPTGGGVGLIGMHKAFEELLELRWVKGAPPRMVAVQAAGCAPIVRAFETRSSLSQPWVNPSTIAYGINVPKALGDFLVLETLYATGGTAVQVEDADLLADLLLCGRLEGLFLCPEGAACIRAVRLLRESGWLRGDELTVVLNTGAGLKYPDVVAVDLPVRDPSDVLSLE